MNELTIEINANQLRTKNQLCKVMAENCRFPAYFGGGLDAVNDCMGDLSWFPEDKITIKIRNLAQLKAKNLAMYQLVGEMMETWEHNWRFIPEKQVIIEHC